MSSRLHALLRLRFILPNRAAQWLLQGYWRRHWRRVASVDSDVGAPLLAPLLGDSERTTLIEAISEAYPFSRALEVGAGYGQNFHVLARLFPNAEFLGVERQLDSVQQGNAFLHAQHVQNASLVQGDAADLSAQVAKSFDVVYSSAALLYVTATEIDTVAQEMLRLARRRIVLLEQHLPNAYHPEQDRGVYFMGRGAVGYWLRDYEKLFARLAPNASIRVQKVSRPLWDTERWRELAHVITVENF